MDIRIEEDGTIQMLGDGDLSEELSHEGLSSSRRVTRVEPVNRALRVIFLLVRNLVSDRSRLAQWTRGWGCYWQARVFNGPTLRGPGGCGFSHRADAIEAETAYLSPKLVLGELHSEEPRGGSDNGNVR